MSAAQDSCKECRTTRGYHAALHAGHLWTRVDCPAYITLNGDDCDCAGVPA